MTDRPDRPATDLDLEALIDTVEEFPVRCAVLYGSQVHGTQTRDSDIDVAVAFDSSLSPPERLDQRVTLTAALVETLGNDRVDVADFGDIRPELGLQAIADGYPLVGETHLEKYREQFEREATASTHEQRMDRLDAILGRLKEKV